MSTSDPRYIVKDIIDAASVTKDNGTSAGTLLFAFSDAGDRIETLITNFDLLFIFPEPTYNSVRLVDDVPVYEDVTVPLVVVAFNKSGVTAENMLYKADAQIRTLVEGARHTASGASKLINVGRPTYKTTKVGVYDIHEAKYNLLFKQL